MSTTNRFLTTTDQNSTLATESTLQDLGKEFPESVVKVVDYLTKRDGEKQFDYIKRVKLNEIATEIKIADIVDNLSDTISIQPQSMIDRYNKSLDILTK